MSELAPEDVVVPAEEVEDQISLLDPDILDDDPVTEDDVHPDNDDEEPLDDVSA